MPSSPTLIDTGAILALLDRSDPWHVRCTSTFERLNLPLFTTEAVLTELFHLLPRGRREMERAWAFLQSGTIQLSSIDHFELTSIHELMGKYWDRPMDFADATLVHLANRESLQTIFTVDHADFQTYRIHGTRKFRVLPSERP